MISEATIKSAIKRAAGVKGAIEVKDGGGRGEGRLCLIVRGSGPGTDKEGRPREERITTEWYAMWWRDGRKRMAKIGSYPALSLADARKEFRESFAPAISAGRDPEAPKARRERRGVTVADLFEAYVEHLKSGERRSWYTAQRSLLGSDGKGGAAAAIGRNVRAADVTVDDVRKHLSEIYDRGVICQADTTRSYIHAAFAWGMKSVNSYKGVSAKVNWGITVNPCAAIPADSEAKRAGNRFLTTAELRAYWEWLSAPKQKGPMSIAARLHICTGQRTEEILRISNQVYDKAEKMLDWSKTKNGLPHTIPLPQQAVDLLDSAPVNSQGLYFPHARRPKEHVTVAAYERLVRRYLKLHPDVPRFTPRDIRRTWKTLAGAAGLSKEMRDRLQNHAAKTDISAKHYDRWLQLPEKRAAMEEWSAYLDLILSGELRKAGLDRGAQPVSLAEVRARRAQAELDAQKRREEGMTDASLARMAGE